MAVTGTAAKAAAKKKPSSGKKPSAAGKSASGTVRLSAAEKKLIRNYRKCSLLEKKVIDALVEKAGSLDAGALLGLLK